MKKVAVVFGTRPEGIKVAPVVRALIEDPSLTPLIVTTGQHQQILDQVLDVFDIKPDIELGLFKPGAQLTDITTAALTALAPVFDREKPDMVVVQGDTTTSFAAALSAFYHQIPVAHMEAGLRTDDKYSPFPEEINRRLATQLSDLHLAPTPLSEQNLLRENVDPRSIVVTGNTVIDALLWTVNQPVTHTDPALAALATDPRRMVLVTAHRRESWGEGMHGIGAALSRLSAAEPDVVFVFPIHPNPKVRDIILPYVEGRDNVIITEPQEYQAFAALINRAHIVLTDSGGVQEEAPSLGRPVLVMRKTTERPEGVEAGSSMLVGTDPNHIFNSVTTLLHNDAAYKSMSHAVNPYGDGLAAKRTVGAIKHYLNLGEPVASFVPTLTLEGDTMSTPSSLTERLPQ